MINVQTSKKYQKWGSNKSRLICKPMVLASMLYLISELEETLAVIQLPNFENDENKPQRREMTRL